jgi:Zn-dependent protease with chaperone function
VSLTGTYYDGATSHAEQVELSSSADRQIRIHGSSVDQRFHIDDLKISDRIGNIPRALELPGGGRCDVSNNDALDSFLEQLGYTGNTTSWIHVLESRWRYVALAMVITGVFSWSMFVWGIPALADHAARALPTSVDRALGQGTLKILDRGLLAESELDTAVRQRLRQRFDTMTHKLEDGSHYRLEFRAGKKIGANALALPSGIIIVTDELVELAANDDEVIAVLAHEIGHLVHRHSVRLVMQDSAVVLLVTTITGDAFSTSSLAAALPIVLLHSSYSQEFETEADRYARDYLVDNNIPTGAFADILERISDDEDTSAVEKYLSTHPGTPERIKMFSENDQ